MVSLQSKTDKFRLKRRSTGRLYKSNSEQKKVLHTFKLTVSNSVESTLLPASRRIFIYLTMFATRLDMSSWNEFKKN